MSTSETYVSVPIPCSLFTALYEFLKGEGDVRDPVTLVPIAVEYWIENASWKPDFLQVAKRGFRWKELFLPEGTKIRMKYKSKTHYAEVVGDDFMWGGRVSSPSQFANGVTGTSRNAWRDLEILRPVEHEWKLAQSLRGVSDV